MSQPCAIVDCKRSSRALCHCCHQNLCRYHLNEHDDLLNDRLNPFADQVNELNDRHIHLKARDITASFDNQLEHWRRESHRLIDEYVETKKQILEQSVNMRILHASECITHLKTMISQLIQKQDTTTEDLNAISSTLKSAGQEISQIEYKCIDVNVNPLEIDPQSIRIGDEMIKNDFNLSTLISPLHRISRSADCPKPLISNGKFLLIHHENQLSLLNEELTIIRSIPWNHSWIWDMCWSSTLSRFFIITHHDIFLLDHNTMSLEHLETKDKYSFSACTCSDTSLYMITNELGSSICEYSLLPKIELKNRQHRRDLCEDDELIQDIVFNRGTFAFIVENQTHHTKRMELRSGETLKRLWWIQFDGIDPLHNIFRLCLMNDDKWLVIDWKNSHVFYITKDGQIKSTCVYEAVPYRCCQFGSNILVISAKNSINFHKI